MAVENANFSFLEFFFPPLWRTLSRKLMKRPAIFITYFQSTIQNVHVYQILPSEYFFQKFVDRFNLMSTFLAFHHFCEKTNKKTYQFYDLFSNLLSNIVMCTLIKFRSLKIFFPKMVALSDC